MSTVNHAKLCLCFQVCKDGQSFVVINQKGIDPISLDMLAREGVSCPPTASSKRTIRVPALSHPW